MIKEIKNTNDVQGYVFRHDKEDMLIHYEERKRGEGSKPNLIVLDENSSSLFFSPVFSFPVTLDISTFKRVPSI